MLALKILLWAATGISVCFTVPMTVYNIVRAIRQDREWAREWKRIEDERDGRV